jgi:hypothetical protein
VHFVAHARKAEIFLEGNPSLSLFQRRLLRNLGVKGVKFAVRRGNNRSSSSAGAQALNPDKGVVRALDSEVLVRLQYNRDVGVRRERRCARSAIGIRQFRFTRLKCLAPTEKDPDSG